MIDTYSMHQTIERYASQVYETLIQIRRELHQRPELSGQESWAAGYLGDRLDRVGFNVRRNVGGHGLIADLILDPSRPTVALRLDMDALPIHETNTVPYRSQVPGVMHACGHDVHSAIGIGTVAVLMEMADTLPGNIRLIFQPEEEQITGALSMIRDGALVNPVPTAIFGLHVAPIPVGQVAWSNDLFLAGFDHYLGILSSQNGFTHSPNHLDAIARHCCRVIRSFNKFHLPQTWESMQAFWQMMQDGPHDLQHFIIYDATPNDEDPTEWHGQFGVGIKAANHHLRRAARARVKTALERICRVTHTRFRLEPMGSMIDMRNNSDLINSALPALKQAIGDHNTIQLEAAFPFNCEDFAYYTKTVPGAMVWIGAADPSNGKYAILHTSNFDVDERCLKTGTIAMTTLILNSLNKETSSG